MTYTPTVRQPTGIPAAPLIMVSGPPKSGKSMTAYKLGQSDRIDNCWVIDLGEGSADEYGQLGCYTVLDWGSSWSDLADTVAWCVAQPAEDGRQNAVVIDSGSELWEALKDRAARRARRSKRNAQALKDDPDAEIDVSMNYWNDAAATWTKIVNPLRVAAHVVGVVLVRAEIVAEVVNGSPTKNRVTSYQAHKSLPAVVTAHVEVRPDHSAHLVEVRSATVSVPPRGLALKSSNPLGEVVDLLAPADGGFAGVSVSAPVDGERGESDPARDAAVVLHRRAAGLSDEEKVVMREWAQAEGVTLTVSAMADSAALRAKVAAKLDGLAAAAPVQEGDAPEVNG